MSIAARWWLTGLLAGVFLAIALQQLTPHIQVPVRFSRGPRTSTTPLSDSDSMAQVLRNIARGVVRGAGGSGSNYKSSIAASSSVLHSLALSSPTASASTSSTSLTPTRSFASTPTMASTKSVLEAIKERRTYYELNKEAPISDAKITELVEQALLHVPSSFNSQSTRLVVLLNKDHEQFWDYVIEVLKPLTPEDKFDGTKQKINGFRAAYGTVSCNSFSRLDHSMLGCAALRVSRPTCDVAFRPHHHPPPPHGTTHTRLRPC